MRDNANFSVYVYDGGILHLHWPWPLFFLHNLTYCRRVMSTYICNYFLHFGFSEPKTLGNAALFVATDRLPRETFLKKKNAV